MACSGGGPAPDSHWAWLDPDSTSRCSTHCDSFRHRRPPIKMASPRWSCASPERMCSRTRSSPPRGIPGWGSCCAAPRACNTRSSRAFYLTFELLCFSHRLLVFGDNSWTIDASIGFYLSSIDCCGIEGWQHWPGA